MNRMMNTRMTSMKPRIMARMMMLILKEIGKKTVGVKKTELA